LLPYPLLATSFGFEISDSFVALLSASSFFKELYFLGFTTST
jgi:hypothetical protein